MEDTREIALSLLREVGSSTDRDIVRPKRMGVGITFEVVGSLNFFQISLPRKLSVDLFSGHCIPLRWNTILQQAVDNAVTVKKCVRGSPACKSGLIQNGDVS